MSALGRIFQVAKREYKHHARSKGFWLTMVAVPVVAVLAGLIPQWVQENKPARAFLVVDQSGGAIEAAIDKAVSDDTEKRALSALKDYAADNLPPESVPALSPLAPSRGELTEADLAAFRAWGGIEQAERILPGLAREGAPAFVPYSG